MLGFDERGGKTVVRRRAAANDDAILTRFRARQTEVGRVASLKAGASVFAFSLDPAPGLLDEAARRAVNG